MEEQLKIDFEKKLKDFSYSDQEKKFRETNFKEFLKKGFPNRKLENWKFSDLNQIIKSNIGELTFYNDYKKENQIDKIELISELEHNKIIIVDGKIEKIDFKFDGEMQPDVALEETYKELYPFSEIVGNANVLIMPSQHSAAISFKTMKSMSRAKVIGPLLIGLGQAIEIAPLRSSTSEILNLASIAAYSSDVIDYSS